MKTVELANAAISVLDNNLVLFTAKAGVVVDSKSAEGFYEEIEKLVDGDYGIIINRENRYQLLRVEVFNVINSRKRLKGLAIVATKETANKMAKMEAPLCKKPFETFQSVDEAVKWLKSL